MDFKQAKDAEITFGKYKGQTLDQIAASDSGLLYLDWLRGEGIRIPALREAVEVYLSDEVIAKELAAAMDGGK